MKLIVPAVDRLQRWFDDALVWVLDHIQTWCQSVSAGAGKCRDMVQGIDPGYKNGDKIRTSAYDIQARFLPGGGAIQDWWPEGGPKQTSGPDHSDIAITPETLARLSKWALEERQIAAPSLIFSYANWIILRTRGMAQFTNEDMAKAFRFEGPEVSVYGYRVKMYIDSHLGQRATEGHQG